MTTPPEPPDPWAPDPGRTSHWDQPPGTPAPPPGWPPQPPPGWGTPPGRPPMPPPPGAPPPGWPQQAAPGDWSAPGYGYWGAARNNGMGTAALVLGILGLLTSWTIVGGAILGTLGLIFGLIGRGRVKRREADNGGAALTGVITGSIGIAISAGLIVWGVVLALDSQQKYEDCIRDGGSFSFCRDKHDPPDP